MMNNRMRQFVLIPGLRDRSYFCHIEIIIELINN